jgi:hypothetical protein
MSFHSSVFYHATLEYSQLRVNFSRTAAQKLQLQQQPQQRALQSTTQQQQLSLNAKMPQGKKMLQLCCPPRKF